jgi:benzoylformate decarboxylase
MGCDAARVTKSSELAGALKRALAHKGTSLVEVMVDSAVPVLYARKGWGKSSFETPLRGSSG